MLCFSISQERASCQSHIRRIRAGIAFLQEIIRFFPSVSDFMQLYAGLFTLCIRRPGLWTSGGRNSGRIAKNRMAVRFRSSTGKISTSCGRCGFFLAVFGRSYFFWGQLPYRQQKICTLFIPGRQESRGRKTNISKRVTSVHSHVDGQACFSTPYPLAKRQTAAGFGVLFHRIHTPYCCYDIIYYCYLCRWRG